MITPRVSLAEFNTYMYSCFFYQRRKLRYFSVNFASSFPSFNPFPPLFPLTFPSFLLDSFLNKNLIMSR